MERPEQTNTDEKQMTQPQVSSSTRPLSIEGVQNTSRSIDSQIPASMQQDQPRQPTDLQGLLRYAIQASNSQGSVNNTPQFAPMDAERQRFLEEAVSSLTVNVIEELKENIQILSNVVDLCSDDDTEQHEVALDRLADCVDNIDVANDFHKIGGFSIFGPCLNSPHSSIRWRTAHLIAELAQNNPYCQDKCLEAGLFPVLLTMIESDPVETVRIKALHAVSCIVREHPMSMKYMDKHDGYSILLRAIQSSVKKLQIKSAFLLCSLCNRHDTNNLQLSLINMGLIEQAAGLLASEELLPEIRDQLLNILHGLIKCNVPAALSECRRSELCLESTLERCIKDLKQEENFEQIDICNEILNHVFLDCARKDN